ncbi:hypothetical protein [Macrococcus animalis]|uniref:hypothetical protein n=1 Tax=Macrococcus animalis TaxID=3395467 RepID=UPI0039BE17D6
MQLKTLSLNKALFSNLSRSIIFLTIINIICTFILVPFSYVIAHIDSGAGPHNHSKYLIGETMTMPIYFVGTMLYALLCAAFLTYYFKSQAASDFIHSLPIKRERILITAYAVFLSHLLVDLLLNGLITWIVGIKYASIDIEKIVIWILVNLVIDFFIFTITMLFGLFINNMLNHLVSSLILIASPFILGTMVYTTHMFMFKGLQNYPDELMTNLTVPIRFINDIAIDQVDFKYLIMIFLVSTVIFILLFVIYKQRKNERINEAYSTNYAHFFVFFISMLIATLLGGIIFNSIFNEQKFITIFIYLVSFTLIYIFLEMIAQKSVRINFDRKLYAITLGMIAVAIVAIYISGQMRENYVPEVEEVESVVANIGGDSTENGENLLNQIPIKDEKTIQNIIEAQREIIKRKKHDDMYEKTVIINYFLKSGKKISRMYDVNSSQYKQYIKTANKNNSDKTMIDDIPWDKIKYNDLELMSMSDINLLKDIDADKNYWDSLEPVLKNTLALNKENQLNEKFMYSTLSISINDNINTKKDFSATEGQQTNIPISIYDTKMLNYLVDNHQIKSKSAIYGESKVYFLGNENNFKKAYRSNDLVTKMKFAKKINNKEFFKLIDENKASIDGTEYYYIEDTSTYVAIKK